MPLRWRIEGKASYLADVFAERKDWKDWWEVFAWDPESRSDQYWKYLFFDTEAEARQAREMLGSGWAICQPMNMRMGGCKKSSGGS